MRNVFRIYFRQTLVDVSNKDFLAKCRKNVLKSYNEECCLSVPVWDPQVAEERCQEGPFAFYTKKCLEFIDVSQELGTGCEAVGQDIEVDKSHDHKLYLPAPRRNPGFWR